MGARRWSTVAAAALLLQAVPIQALAGSQPDPNVSPPLDVRLASLKAPGGYNPAQMLKAYGFDQVASLGIGQTIGIVDAFDSPTVAGDLQAFIGQFGIPMINGVAGLPTCSVAAGPHPCFQKVAQGHPEVNSTWALEIALDVQWAHAIAPSADILLVETPNSSLSTMLRGVDEAVSDGANVISMSWGAPEFAQELHDDAHFRIPDVAFLAASGDTGNGVYYPAASPYVVGVGGTTLPLDSIGNLSGAETAWKGSGGGISAFEPEPFYQQVYPVPASEGKRGVPDVAYDADPVTGVGVFNTTVSVGTGGWFTVGGTSVGAPQWAALVARANSQRRVSPSSADLLRPRIYRAATGTLASLDFRDILSGTNGSCGTICSATPGYDFVTGLGSPLAGHLVRQLAG